MMKLAYFVVLLVAAARQCAATDDGSETKWAVDIISSPENGQLHLQVPYHPSITEPLPEKSRQIIAQDAKELFAEIENVAVKVIGQSIWGQAKTLIPAGYKMVNLNNAQRERRRANGVLSTDSSVLYADLRKFMKKASQDSEIIEKELKKTEPKDNDKLKKDVGNLIGTVKEAVLASPVGGYISFDKAIVDGEKFADRAALLMARMRRANLSKVFFFIDLLLARGSK